MAATPLAAALPSAGAGASSRPRLRLRSTPHMRMLVLIILLMALAAINYQSNAAWALVMALVSALGVSVLHTRRNLALVQVSSLTCAPAFAGEEADAQLTLTAGGQAVTDISVIIAELDQARGSCAALGGDGPALVMVRIPRRARGVTQVRSLRLATTYPFGLIEAWCEVPVAATAVVYPSPSGIPALAGTVTGLLAPGQEPSSNARQAGTDDFSGHRRFSAGDPRTLIDWKAHARAGSLLIKRFTGGTARTVWCDWRMTRGDREARLSQLAAGVLAAQRSGCRYGVRLERRELAPGQGEAHLHECLRMLAEEPA